MLVCVLFPFSTLFCSISYVHNLFQLCAALAFAHEKGVSHHDVKAANILIDTSAGGKLLLADFGTALKPGEETVGFTKSYASPELLASHELEDFGDLRADMNDAFALGCVIYELLMCKNLENLSADQTLGEFISDEPGGLAAALGNVALPWLPSNNGGVSASVGYTNELRNLVANFLKPANERLLPGQVQQSIKGDPLSPLLLPRVSAAQTARPGAPVTIDNVQLGMLVQRGVDWSDGDDDGGLGSVGVIVKLDGDGNYVWVSFPSQSSVPESMCCRMGASNKYELQVCCPLPDYVSGNGIRNDGIVHVGHNISSVSVGQKINQNCMVVGTNESLEIAFVAPLDKVSVPQLPVQTQWRTSDSSFVKSKDQTDTPSTWQLGTYAEVKLNSEEGKDILDLLYDKIGGLKLRDCPVESIQRVQDKSLWGNYMRSKQKVSAENWGIDNEMNAFMGYPGSSTLSTFLANWNPNGKHFSTKATIIRNKTYDKFHTSSKTGTESKMLLCRVVVGRILDTDSKNPNPTLMSHSEVISKDLYASRGPCLAYPEYIITYKDNSAPPLISRDASSGGRSESKMCIICLERPVRYLTIPCGHPCLCEKCNNAQIRRKLKGKCPECRRPFHSTAIIFGRVVNDE